MTLKLLVLKSIEGISSHIIYLFILGTGWLDRTKNQILFHFGCQSVDIIRNVYIFLKQQLTEFSIFAGCRDWNCKCINDSMVSILGSETFRY